MTSMDDREKSFENKYAYDIETNFRIEAKASKYFGLWAAGKLGLSGQDAENYAREVIGANLEEAGLEDIVRKVRSDFDAKKIDVPEPELRKELKKSMDTAEREVRDAKS